MKIKVKYGDELYKIKSVVPFQPYAWSKIFTRITVSRRSSILGIKYWDEIWSWRDYSRSMDYDSLRLNCKNLLLEAFERRENAWFLKRK